MRRFIAFTVAVALAGAAAAQPAPGAVLGTDRTSVAKALKAHGLELMSFEKEGRTIEVKAKGKSGRTELKIDARSGKLRAHEAEDER